MKRITMRELLRLFYRYMIDFIPVVDESGQLSGVLLKDRMIGLTGGDLRDIDRPVEGDVVASFLDSVDEAKQYLPALADRGETKIPVLRLSGELFGFWSSGELLEAIGGKKVLSASFLMPLLEEIPLALGLFSKSGDFIFMNSSFRAFLSDAEVKKWHEDKIKEFLKDPKREEVRLSVGDKKWSGILAPMREGEHGGGGIFIWEDITDLDRVLSKALKLAALQRGFEKVFDLVREAFWCIDSSGKVLFSNPAFESLFSVYSSRGKSVREIFGKRSESLPIVKSLRDGIEVDRSEIAESPQGRRMALRRRAIPIKVGDSVIGAMEIISQTPVRRLPAMGEWMDLGGVSKEALKKVVEAIKKGSVFIWGPTGVGKTHLGTVALSEVDNVFFLDRAVPDSLRNGDLIFVENLDSFSDEERRRLFELFSNHKAVVTSRLPPSHYSFPFRERFEEVIYLPPICERWDEAERFLAFKVEGVKLEGPVLNRIREMKWKRNFHDLNEFLRKLLAEGRNGFNGFLNERLTLKEALEKKEKEIIEEALRSCDGNITKAAKVLGIPRQTLQYKLKKFGIKG